MMTGAFTCLASSAINGCFLVWFIITFYRCGIRLIMYLERMGRRNGPMTLG